MSWPFADLWDRALTYEQFVKESKEQCQLWTGVYRTARIPDWAIDRVTEMNGRIRVVVIAEDWCGDASNSVPVLAKWAELAENVELRILRRDEHPEVMDRYLTNGTRSIPIVILLNESMEELGSWGPRPSELQELVMAQRRAGRTKQDYYPEVRRWYAEDHGETMLKDVLEVLARAGAGVPSQPS
jgi:hypothetical protein